MTFSIVGFCEETGLSGVAITTSSIAVGSRCPWVRAKVGAVTTQNVTDPSIGKCCIGPLPSCAACPSSTRTQLIEMVAG